ncbi:TPA_asm: hypothetical protein [Girado virus 3]|nr:TPA_asm: hypothetical protein [Girado virus 3]
MEFSIEKPNEDQNTSLTDILKNKRTHETDIDTVSCPYTVLKRSLPEITNKNEKAVHFNEKEKQLFKNKLKEIKDDQIDHNTSDDEISLLKKILATINDQNRRICNIESKLTILTAMLEKNTSRSLYPSIPNAPPDYQEVKKISPFDSILRDKTNWQYE